MSEQDVNEIFRRLNSIDKELSALNQNLEDYKTIRDQVVAMKDYAKLRERVITLEKDVVFLRGVWKAIGIGGAVITGCAGIVFAIVKLMP